MAKKKAAETTGPQTEFEQRVPDKDFNKVVDECHRIKENAAEYIGQLGNYRRNQAERLGLNNPAFAAHLRLDRMEETKRQDYYRSLIQYGLSRGHFAQVDAFDDLRTLFDRIVAAPSAPQGDNVVVLNDLAAAE